MGKAKPAHHTSKQLADRAKQALQNKGGGNAGKADRQGGAAGHAKYQCPLCGQAVPDMKTGQAHWDSKHSKLPFVAEDWENKQAALGGKTTVGVAVQGSKKKKK